MSNTTKKKIFYRNNLQHLRSYITLREHADEILNQEKELRFTWNIIERSKSYYIFSKLHNLKKLLNILITKENYGRLLDKTIILINKIIFRLLLLTPFRKSDIFVFGIIAYRYRKQRPQHLCEYLSTQGHRVFYIENGFITDSRKFDSKELQPIVVNKHLSNVYLTSLTATRDISIYSEAASVDDKKRIFSSIDTLRRVFGIRKVISIVQHPFWYQFAPFLSAPVIYDCMDEHIGFEDTSKKMTYFEKELVKKSESIIVTSQFLYSKILKQKKKPNIIHNAGEFDHFSLKNSHNSPSDLLKVRKPIIGYYGAIAHWFDVRLVEKVAKAFPTVSIVLIGEITQQAIRSVAKRNKNVILLGEKPYESLPSYLNYFDVCLIPFLKVPLTLATNPVKIFEYFAQGKPVVSVTLPELVVYKKIMYLAANSKQFIRQVSNALNESKNSSLKEKRIQIAKQNTWRDRGKQLDEILSKVERNYYEHKI